MNSIVHFEIPVDDVDRAMKFYTEIFGWLIEKFDMQASSPTEGEPYYLVRTAETDEKHRVRTPGTINGGMMRRRNPRQQFMNYIDVANIDKTLEEVTAHKGVVCMPKTEIAPGMGWVAAFRDLDGNILGLHQRGIESA